MTDEKQRALELARRIADGWNGRFFYDEERGDIAYIAAACDARQCDCPVKHNSDGDQDCSVSLLDVDDAGHDIATMLNIVRPLFANLERCRAVCEAVEHDIAVVTQHRAARTSGGQHVGTGGPLAAANPSMLIYLERLVRDLKRALDRGARRRE